MGCTTTLVLMKANSRVVKQSYTELLHGKFFLFQFHDEVNDSSEHSRADRMPQPLRRFLPNARRLRYGKLS
jgi:hypothetical protein